MTSRDIVTIEHEGVVCKSDAALYEEGYDIHTIHFLSIYGAPQQTKALFSALASYRRLTAGRDTFTRPADALRYRGFSMGYGKHHNVIWTEQLDTSIIVWSSEEEKASRLRNILSRRRIPYEPCHLDRLEKLLVEYYYLVPLSGWGLQGYQCNFHDDDICDLIVSEVYS